MISNIKLVKESKYCDATMLFNHFNDSIKRLQTYFDSKHDDQQIISQIC